MTAVKSLIVKQKHRNSFLNKVKKIFKINKETKVAHVKGVSRRRQLGIKNVIVELGREISGENDIKKFKKRKSK